MKRILILMIAVYCFNAFPSFSQIGNFKFGLKLYSQLAYSEAIPYFEKSLQSDSTNTEALRKLASCYREVNDINSSRILYSKVILLNDVKPIEKYYYGQALMMSGDYNNAKTWLNAYHEDERGKLQAEGINNINNFFKDSAQYTVKNLTEINSPSSDFGPAFFEKSILFSSNRYKIDAINNNHSWTGKDFYKLFQTDEANISTIVKFTNDVQTKYNVGPICFDSKNKILYLTRNQIEKGKAIKGIDDQIKLRIYSYIYNEQDEEWTNERSFQYNNKDFNVAHPAISVDGQWIVFSSDMPGGIGGMDLWASQKQIGTWIKPVNLGSTINTKGNEVFPFISSNNILFYSSDGKEGLGGLDVYFIYFKNGKSGKLKTISYPVNSMGDDFGFILNNTGNIAYFSSNRPGGKGDDDIYLINVRKPFKATVSVSGTAIDKQSKLPLAETLVLLKEENGDKIDEVTTGKDGFYEFEIESDKSYKLIGTKSEYSIAENNFQSVIPEDKAEITSDLLLDKNNYSLYCIVTDKKTNLPIKGVSLKIKENNTESELFSFITNENGDCRQPLEKAKMNDQLVYEMNIDINKTGYSSKKVTFSKTIDKTGEIAIRILIDASLDQIEVVADLAKIIDIKPIYFDLGKWNIRPNAAIELDKIVKVMNENPTMVIELGSHTDCRGSAASNLSLSDKRAKSSVAYITSKGIDNSRIYGKGYGETKLVNDCACEGNLKSDCDEDNHQQNRRTEFVIVKM